MRVRALVAIVAATCCLAACESAMVPDAKTVGPDPTLPPPPKSLVATLLFAPATGWHDGLMPRPAHPDMKVNLFADGLRHPRWLYVLPNGDVLVAETNAPPHSLAHTGFRKVIAWLVMQWSGAGSDSANRITILRDKDGDGYAESRGVFLEGLNSPFGMALVNGDLYVANSDALWRFPYAKDDWSIDRAKGVKVIDFPRGPGTVNHHWTRNIIASADGKKLYVAIGSNSDHMEHGACPEENRARIWEIDLANPQPNHAFATGLRNPNGMGWEPTSQELWTVVNERDELGSDLVPDYLTSVKRGEWYGWPHCYYRKPDTRVGPGDPDHCTQTPPPPVDCLKMAPPDYALGNHVAPLGLVFSQGAKLPQPFVGGAFIGQHGSWNRRPFSGYDVVFVPFENGKPKPGALPIPVLGGFQDQRGRALGRPVGLAIDIKGGLLVADDVGNRIWRVAGCPC